METIKKQNGGLIMEERNSCKNCRFYAPDFYEIDDDSIESDFGECHRFPPKNVSAEERGFPLVENTTWCGEFDF